MPVPDRCAAHPGRPAVDACPVCGRPRCAVDATGPDCPVCRAGRAARPDRVRRQAQQRELLLRATLASNFTAIAMGYVASEYVQAEYFQYLAPMVLGLLCGFAATSAAGNQRGVLANRIRLVCTVYAVLGTAFGFVLEGTFGVLSASTDVLLPYLLAAAAAWFWTTPPKRRKKPATAS